MIAEGNEKGRGNLRAEWTVQSSDSTVQETPKERINKAENGGQTEAESVFENAASEPASELQRESDFESERRK